MRVLMATLACVVVAGCKVTGAFTCETSDQCRASTGQGVCESATGFCAFADATCPSGFRYAESAGDALANQCTDAAMADAGVDDALAFDPSTCPPEYTGMLDGITTARYLLIPAGTTAQGRFGNQIQRCSQAMPGATHAVTVDNAVKAAALAAFISDAQQHVWIGLIQDPVATTVDGGWISFIGDAPPMDQWAKGEPDDANEGEGDHAQQVGAFSSMGLSDMVSTESYPVVCECDGRAISATAMDFLNRKGD
ncbi:MAG: hypothetical protein ACKV2T_35055 [Kofleriaceae bacterium]